MEEKTIFRTQIYYQNITRSQHKKIASHSVLRGKQDKPTETGKGEAR
jgi:hypothetical protein